MQKIKSWYIPFLAMLICLKCQASAIEIDLVPDEHTAIKIAEAVLPNYMGLRNFDKISKNQSLKATLDKDTWSVFFYPKSESSPSKPVTSDGRAQIKVIIGGGGPVLEISKHDAQV